MYSSSAIRVLFFQSLLLTRMGMKELPIHRGLVSNLAKITSLYHEKH